MSQQKTKKQTGWLSGLLGFGSNSNDRNQPAVQNTNQQETQQARLPAPRRERTSVIRRTGVAKDIFGADSTPDVLMQKQDEQPSALLSDTKPPKAIDANGQAGVPTRLSARMKLAMKENQAEQVQTQVSLSQAAPAKIDFTDPAKIKEQLDKLMPEKGIVQSEQDSSPKVAQPFKGDPFSDLFDQDATISIGSAAKKQLLDYKSGDDQKVPGDTVDRRESKPSGTESPEDLDNQYRGKIKPIKVKMGRKMSPSEIENKTDPIVEDKEEQRNPLVSKEIKRDLGTLAFLRMQEEFEQAILNKAPLPSYIQNKNGPANNYGLDEAPVAPKKPETSSSFAQQLTSKQTKANPLPEPKPIPAPSNKQFSASFETKPTPNRIDTSEIQARALTQESKSKAEFLNAPKVPEIISQSEIEASCLSDQDKSEKFKAKIKSEKTAFKPLVNKVIEKGSEPELQFDAALNAVEEPPNPQPDITQEFNDWVSEVERSCPPLYKREPRLHKREPSEKIKRNLEFLPVAGRSVAFSTLINSWSRMGAVDKARAMVIQPDFVRLDEKEFLDHEIFMGTTHLPTYRTHGLYKAKSEICGPLAGKAIHLSRPIVTIEPNQSVESSIKQKPQLFKRTFTEPAFSRWNEKGSNYGATLLDELVQHSLPRLTKTSRMTMKNAALLARALYTEFQGQTQAAQDDPGFNLRFLEKNGFLPSETLYLFLEVPCFVKTQAGIKSYPLWQAILKDPKLSFSQVQVENMPADMLLLHLIATVAEMSFADPSLLRMMAIADKLIRVGDYSIGNEVFQKSDDPNENKSFAVLKAFEQIVSREDKAEQALEKHKLGAYRIVQCTDNNEPEEDDEFSQSLFEHIQMTHSGLRQQLVAAGLWRNDIELVIRSNTSARKVA